MGPLATGLLFSWTADLIALVALAIFLALAGMEHRREFGSGCRREVMIASLADPP